MKQKTLEFLLELSSRKNLDGWKLDNFLSDAKPWEAYDVGYDDGRMFLAMAILKMENNDELPERTRCFTHKDRSWHIIHASSPEQAAVVLTKFYSEKCHSPLVINPCDMVIKDDE